MKTFNAEVKTFLDANKMWVLATAGDTPNVVPVYFTKVLNDNRLMLVDVFMKKTIENIKKILKWRLRCTMPRSFKVTSSKGLLHI